jgi:hypothetical protein
MTRDYMAIERAREAGLQPDYKDTKDCGCRECFLENEVERLTTERDAAFRRGAEAMREAAAQKVTSYNIVVVDPAGRAFPVLESPLQTLADELRALSIPEMTP